MVDRVRDDTESVLFFFVDDFGVVAGEVFTCRGLAPCLDFGEVDDD